MEESKFLFSPFYLVLHLFFFCQKHWCGSLYSVEQAKTSHVYSYRHGFKGFAAKLTEAQASEICSKAFILLLITYFDGLHSVHYLRFMKQIVFNVETKQKCLEWYLYFPIPRGICIQLIHGILWGSVMMKQWKSLVFPPRTRLM